MPWPKPMGFSIYTGPPGYPDVPRRLVLGEFQLLKFSSSPVLFSGLSLFEWSLLHVPKVAGGLRLTFHAIHQRPLCSMQIICLARFGFERLTSLAGWDRCSLQEPQPQHSCTLHNRSTSHPEVAVGSSAPLVQMLAGCCVCIMLCTPGLL